MSLFDKIKKLQSDADLKTRAKVSKNWFLNKAKGLFGPIDRRELMKTPPIQERLKVVSGRMYMFYYDPRHKKTLPYYDRFPVIIMVEEAPGGFYGLNLHYLPPLLRARLLDKLMELSTSRRFDENTKLKISYQLLKNASKYKAFKPCFKRYLISHVKSRFGHVPANEWERVALLPVALWTKASAEQVYKDSRKIIKNG
jgi:hypothetical protein